MFVFNDILNSFLSTDISASEFLKKLFRKEPREREEKKTANQLIYGPRCKQNI